MNIKLKIMSLLLLSYGFVSVNFFASTDFRSKSPETYMDSSATSTQGFSSIDGSGVTTPVRSDVVDYNGIDFQFMDGDRQSSRSGSVVTNYSSSQKSDASDVESVSLSLKDSLHYKNVFIRQLDQLYDALALEQESYKKDLERRRNLVNILKDRARKELSVDSYNQYAPQIASDIELGKVKDLITSIAQKHKYISAFCKQLDLIGQCYENNKYKLFTKRGIKVLQSFIAQLEAGKFGSEAEIERVVNACVLVFAIQPKKQAKAPICYSNLIRLNR